MRKSKLANVTAMSAAFIAAVVLIAPQDAEARRGGSFGSRGARTHQAPATTNVAPQQAAPMQRSMTDKPAAGSQAARSQAAQPKNAPSKFGGMAKGLIGGLIAGGLIAALLGGGLGSLAGAGMLMALLQMALIGGAAYFLIRMFRHKPAMATANGGAMAMPFSAPDIRQSPAHAPAPAPVQSFGFSSAEQGSDIEINDADRNDFERMLSEVQDAFGKEDYARLRTLSTPEIMSYFAEELSQNATNGRRNQVSGTTLIDAEVAEAWNEGSSDYATIAMRYESIDIMVDRNSGAVLEGDPNKPTLVTELWTFRRDAQAAWQLSAIQEA